MTEAVDMTGETVLITGATSGIGRESALTLARRGAAVIVHGRDRERGQRVVADIERETGRRPDLLLADLAAQDAVRVLASEVRERYDRLDVLVNNAGTYRPKRELVEGVEVTFAVNHLAPYLLTHELATLLVASGGRVVTVASGLHRRGTIHFEDLSLADEYTTREAYAQSKLANVLFTLELADRFEDTDVTATAADPGAIPATRLGRDAGLLSSVLFRLLGLIPGFANDIEQGAATVVYLASSPDVEGVSGAYFADCDPVEPSSVVDDRETRRRLWDVSAELVGVDTDWGLPDR